MEQFDELMFDELKALGVDVQAAVERFMGNGALYKKFLGKFAKAPRDEYYVPVDFDAENYEKVLAKAHTIKGVTANLGIDPLYKAYDEIVTLLRDGEIEEARRILEKTIPVQNEIIACIEKHMA